MKMTQTQHTPGPWDREIERMISSGRSDDEIVARHSFAWRERARSKCKAARAAITKAEGR